MFFVIIAIIVGIAILIIIHRYNVHRCHHNGDVIWASWVSNHHHSTVYSTVFIGLHQRKYQDQHYSPFSKGIHHWQAVSPFKGQVTWKMFPSHIVIMLIIITTVFIYCYFSMLPDKVIISVPWYNTTERWIPEYFGGVCENWPEEQEKT